MTDELTKPMYYGATPVIFDISFKEEVEGSIDNVVAEITSVVKDNLNSEE